MIAPHGGIDGTATRKRAGRVNFVRRIRAVGLTAVVLFWTTSPVCAGEYYFLLVFGSQSRPKQLRYTHTWATFVRAVGDGPNLNDYALYVHTISWLPQTLDVHVWRRWPERGVNLDLYQTLQTVSASRQDVSLWGPFVLPPDVYQKSLQVRQILESGQMKYRAIDGGAERWIDDCIHAVSAVDPVFGRRHYPLIRVGKPASRFIAREVMVQTLEDDHIDQTAYDASWLIPRLGLNRYRIEVVPPQRIPARRCFLCRLPD
jgi:hypothetical protein